MEVFKGKGVCGSAAAGKVRVFERQGTAVEKKHVRDCGLEKKRFEEALEKARAELGAIHEKALKDFGEENAKIFVIHMMMLGDEDYIGSVKNIIDTQQVNAEYAVYVTSGEFAEMFSSMDDEYMKARAADVRDISARIISVLSGGGSRKNTSAGRAVIIADDLAPSETVSLDKENVLAFATARGSLNSHTAILARSMDIPAVICAGEELLRRARDGMTAAVDAETGEVFLEPDKDTVERLEKKREEEARHKELLRALKGKENITLDGRRIGVYANIGGTEDIAAARQSDAGGIGLFRSEFLFLGKSGLPSEEVQLAAYKKVLEGMAGKKVVIRTLDIGADKQADCLNLKKEDNPALGLRAIRLCLSRPDIFRTQLRALYRASVYGRLGIMFPMITSVSEVEKILSMCESVKNELKSEGIRYSDDIETGIMIETPAAAVISDKLAPLVDFFSVGTNDLTQYTLACDRQNPELEGFIDPHHEALLRLIELSAENAHKNGAWIGICGELAADTELTGSFLRMGIDELSVSPPNVLRVREKVRSLDLSS